MLTAKHEVKILTRAIKPRKKGLSPEIAQALLDIQLDDVDRVRLHELVLKNQSGTLTGKERLELDSYLNIGMFIDLLQAKARLSLGKSIRKRNTR